MIYLIYQRTGGCFNYEEKRLIAYFHRGYAIPYDATASRRLSRQSSIYNYNGCFVLGALGDSYVRQGGQINARRINI